MEAGTDRTGAFEKNEGPGVFSRAVRAGKRTYFFDVKATRQNDQYLTITESKKRFNKEGRYFFEKHKIFLYKEDFDKFMDGLNEAICYIDDHLPVEPDDAFDQQTSVAAESLSTFTNVEFDDLDEVNVEDGMIVPGD